MMAGDVVRAVVFDLDGVLVDSEQLWDVVDRMAAQYGARLPLLPGAVEVVQRLGRRWPLGLASSSPRRLIDTVLKSAGIAQHFQVSVSTEEVEAGKPSPAVYQTVVQRLGVDPVQAIAIEDSSNGLRSAATAGLGVLAVPHAAFPPSEDALALADVVVKGLPTPGLPNPTAELFTGRMTALLLSWGAQEQAVAGTAAAGNSAHHPWSRSNGAGRD